AGARRGRSAGVPRHEFPAGRRSDGAAGTARPGARAGDAVEGGAQGHTAAGPADGCGGHGHPARVGSGPHPLAAPAVGTGPMYEPYYGLNELPFQLTPDTRYLYLTHGQREALSTLEYGLSSAKP